MLHDILVIGAGFSGICAGIRLKQAGRQDFVILDKADGIGGTWWENTYPGAACDIPSHLYCFSFAPNPDWSRKYSPQPEIQAYLERCVERYGLRPHLHLGRHVEALEFEEERGLWRADLAGGDCLRARHVINGSGGLHKPSIPDLPGLENFAGTAMHTAQWNHEVEFAGRDVAVIGSAASAVQAVPELAGPARRVTVFQRTPNFIAPRNDGAYTPGVKRLFARLPFLSRAYRWLLFMRLELLLYPIIMKRKPRQRASRLLRRYRHAVIADPALRAAMEPDYEMGCKRILISDDYYASLGRENVDLVTAGIAGIEPGGVRDRDGVLHPADILIFATGFDLAGHMVAIDVRGRNGVRLRDLWRDAAEAYRGIMVPGLPNYYLTTGPNTGVGTTSVVYMIEATMGWIMQALDLAGDRHLLSVRPEASRRYNDAIQAALGETVWTSGCSSWYRREDGRIETLYPHNARAFRRQLRKPDLADLLLEERSPDASARHTGSQAVAAQ